MINTKVITSYKPGNWSHLRRIQAIYEQHFGTGHQGTTENSHTWHCRHTSANADVKEQ
jgi:hypothetical protein